MSTDRRDFLKFLLGGTALGITSSPLQTIIEAAIFESAKRAHAQQINYNPERFYFNISFPGAPPRWNYDLFLDPYGNGQNVIANTSVATCFEGGSRYTTSAYKTFKVPGYNIHAPWIWGQYMPVSSGGFVPIHSLMKHMMVIQGINTEAPGHDESRLRMEQANGYTVAGFLSDSIKSSFNSVDLSSSYPFSSKTGLSITSTPLSTSNLVQAIMNKFDSSALTINKSLDDDLKIAYQNVLDNLNYDSSVRTPAALNIKKTHEGALELINSSLGNLTTIWNTKYAKYRDIANRAFMDRTRFAGFMDKPVGIENMSQRDRSYQYADARLSYTPDLRDMTKNDMISTMAPIFAVAEFLAENKLATSLQSRINNMSTRQVTSIGGGFNNNLGITHDQHNVGSMIATLNNALMYRALSGCLYEFIGTLKNPSFKGYKFHDTVIRLSGDFNRSARMNKYDSNGRPVALTSSGTLVGTGSDHGFHGQVATLFSGKIQDPIIAGRIYKDASATGMTKLGLPALVGANYAGSWGVGAPVNIEGGNVVLKPGHAISTIATLLGIASPAFNNASLVKVINGQASLIKNDLKLKVVG